MKKVEGVLRAMSERLKALNIAWRRPVQFQRRLLWRKQQRRWVRCEQRDQGWRTSRYFSWLAVLAGRRSRRSLTAGRQHCLAAVQGTACSWSLLSWNVLLCVNSIIIRYQSQGCGIENFLIIWICRYFWFNILPMKILVAGGAGFAPHQPYLFNKAVDRRSKT